MCQLAIIRGARHYSIKYRKRSILLHGNVTGAVRNDVFVDSSG